MASSPATDHPAKLRMPFDGILLAEELLDLAERAQAYTVASGVAIALLRGKDLLVRTSAGTAPEVGTLISDAFLAECLNRRRPLSCRDIESDSRVGPLFRAMKGARSLIAIPICGQPNMRGVMVVIAPLPNAFQPTHTAILMTLSDIISTKIAAREAPETQVEIVDNPPPALTLEPEPAPPIKVAEVPVVAPAPTQVTPPAMKTAPPPIKVAPATPAQGAPRLAPIPVASAPLAATPSPARLQAKPDATPARDMPTVKPADPPVQTVAPAPTPPSALMQMVPAALLKDGPLPLVEATEKPDPGLLNPAEDPARFEAPRSFGVTTTTAPVKLVPGKTAPKPVVPVAVMTKPVRAASISTVAAPSFSSLETPNQDSDKRRFLIPAIGVAAALALAGALWMHRSMSTEIAPPAIPVPAAMAVSTPPAAPVASDAQALAKYESSAKSEAVATPAVAEPALPKASKPVASQAATAEAKHGPAKPVIEIAAAQPQPGVQAESDMPAPKLVTAAADANVANLSRVKVALPVPPASELVPAALVSRTAPVYPALARQLGISGTVVINLTIGANGSVTAVRITDGPMQLRAAAADAVRQWRYKPATLNGKPVDSSAQVQVNFTR